MQALLRFGAGLLVLLLPLWLDPWASLPFEPAKATLLRSAVFTLGLAALALLILNRQAWSSAKMQLLHAWPLIGGALLYGAVFSLAGLLSVEPRFSFWGGSDRHGVVTLWSQIGLFLLLLLTLTGQKEREQIVQWLLLASLPGCLYGLVQAAGLDPLVWASDSVSPVLSTLGRSNFLGAWLAVLLPLSLYHLHRVWRYPGQNRKQRAGALLLVGLQLLCLLPTLARAGWLAAAAGGLIFYWFGPYAVKPLRHRVVLLAGAALILAFFFLLGEGIGRTQLLNRNAPVETSSTSATVTGDAYGDVRETSMARRLSIWRATWPLIAERSLLGYGPETFATVFNSRYPPGSLYDGTDVLVDDPHNQVLEHLMAGGIVAVGAWLLLLIVLLSGLLRSLNQVNGRQRLLSAACLGAFAAYLVQAQLNPDVVAVSTLFWIITALAWVNPFQEE